VTLLDRFRAKPPWKHDDPAVRADAVRQIASGEAALLAEIARTDPDALVRRAALHRLHDVPVLAERAREDEDEGVRTAAAEGLQRVAMETQDEGEGREAVEALSEARVLTDVAIGARVPAVRRAAASRLTSTRALSIVARRGPDAETRREALARLNDAAALAELALRSEHKDVALAAVERVDEVAALESVAAHGRHKGAARRALERLAVLRPAPPPEAGASEDAPDAVTAAAPETADPPVLPVPADEEAVVEAAVAAPAAPDDPAPAEDGPAPEDARPRLEALCAEMEQAAELPDLEEAGRRMLGLRRRWAAETGLADPGHAARIAQAAARLDARLGEAKAEREAQARDHHAHLLALCERMEALARDPQPALRDCELALREARAAQDDPGRLPAKKDRDAIVARLKAARALLYPRLQELRESDEWTRWANAGVQEDLCARVEALREEKDLGKAAKALRDLEERWKEASRAPREQAEELWRRFKTARDEVHARCVVHFKAEKAKRQENQRRKEALCVEAESLAESRDWVATAQRLQALQAEWKAMGPVPRAQSEALWARFRGACDRFFTRRKEDRARLNADRARGLHAREALVVRAEALAESEDWEAARAEMKRLQGEWKQAGPVRKDKGDALWERFRAAGQRLDDRYRRRGEIDAARRSEALAAVVERVEGLEADGADLAGAVAQAQAEWRQGGGAAAPREMAARFEAALARLVEAAPAAFKGTDLDPEAARQKMERLCKSVEALAGDLPAVPADVSPAMRLAQQWREALAARTMGAAVDEKARRRALREKVDQARAAWDKLGPRGVTDSDALRARFQAACKRVLDAV
jgi:hypothetical protein